MLFKNSEICVNLLKAPCPLYPKNKCFIEYGKIIKDVTPDIHIVTIYAINSLYLLESFHRSQVPFVALVRLPNFTNHQCNIRAYKQMVTNRAIIVSNA